MEKRRFKLDPKLTARENLGLAVRCAVPVVLSRYRLGELSRDTLNELYADIRAAAYAHFIINKVLGHKYCRQTRDGAPLTFFDNVISSVWSVTGNAMDHLMRTFKKKYMNISLEKADYEQRRLYDMLPDTGCVLYNELPDRKLVPTQRLRNQRERPWLFLGSLLDDYVDYCEERKMMGLEPISEDAWVSRNASPEQKITYERKTSIEGRSVHRREWMRNYQRERRARQKEEKCRQRST